MSLGRILTTDDLSAPDLSDLHRMLDEWRARGRDVDTRAMQDGAPPPYQEAFAPATPTSELLEKAARTIHDLLSGRGVDRRNHDWEGFVRELHDRAAAFKYAEESQ